MDNKTEKVYMTLMNECVQFATNPASYFANILDNSLGLMINEFTDYNTEALTKKLTFVRLFVQNWNVMTDKNISKILTYGARESNKMLLNIYSYIALFSDLISSQILTGSVVNRETGLKAPILSGIQDYFLTTISVIDTFLLKYNPSFNEQDITKLLCEIYDKEALKQTRSINSEMYS